MITDTPTLDSVPTDKDTVYSTSISISHPEPNSRSTIYPLSASVVLPPEIAIDCKQLTLRSHDGASISAQTKVLQRWEDGSIRWCRLEWIHSPESHTTEEKLRLEIHRLDGDSQNVDSQEPTTKNKTDWTPEGGNQRDRLEHLLSVQVRVNDGNGNSWVANPKEWTLEEEGLIYKVFQAPLEPRHRSGTQCPLMLAGRVKYYPRIGCAVYQVQVRNPQATDHPGGNWDLGSKGSFFIEDLSVEIAIPPNVSPSTISAIIEQKGAIHVADRSLHLFQCSSGGENWNSSNHMDRNRLVPMAFRGYHAKVDDKLIEGLRSTPIVSIARDGTRFGIAIPKFWQNFPMSLEADSHGFRIGLMPRESGYSHELQGGEQKTYEFMFEIRPSDTESTLESLVLPKQCRLASESYRHDPILRHLSPPGNSSKFYDQLVNSAIEGSESFVSKAEKIDEYGWRHYGDIYGDHEAVYHNGPHPLISHYNNQYDCTAGFAYQWLRTGDRRWHEMMMAMADHAWDIDTYHTSKDKSLYNGGLFWHTYHYADADTGTHRSYPSSLTKSKKLHQGKDLRELGATGRSLEKVYAIGGGPAASHNYSTGWLLAYFLTGKECYKTAAINAADYVIRIEDGAKTPFRWLCQSDTGNATCSSNDYYGPGRASCNSMQALINGYELTNDTKYLTFAVKLMRRTVHPNQDLDKLDLLNAELRWFYTMGLQALARLAETLEALPEFEEDFHYAVESLLHYARWMVNNEHPTLDHPERLQYPTETWAAQDMRKWHVLAHASKWCDSEEESEQMMQRAEFFYQYVIDSLQTFETKSLCRPVVILMNYGWQREELKKTPRRIRNWVSKSWPPLRCFEPQRSIAIRRAKRILMSGVGLGTVLFSGLAVWFAVRFFGH